MDSATLFNQLNELQNQYKQYTPANIGDIYNNLINRVNAFQPQYKELATMGAQAYASPATQMQQYNQQYGNVGGAGALSRLSSILSNVGQQFGTRDVLSNVLDTRKAGLGDMAKTILDQYNTAKQSYMDQYNMKLPLYNSVVSQEQAKANRESSGGSGGGGISIGAGDFPAYQGPISSPQVDQQQAKINLISNTLETTRKTIQQLINKIPLNLNLQTRKNMINKIINDFRSKGVPEEVLSKIVI